MLSLLKDLKVEIPLAVQKLLEVLQGCGGDVPGAEIRRFVLDFVGMDWLDYVGGKKMVFGGTFRSSGFCGL